MEYNNIYRAVVTDNLDPEKRGRIKVTCPSILGEYESNWCIPCYPITGFSTGFFYVPDVNSPVWIMFEEGQPDYPVWLGGWSIPTMPPPTNSDIKEQYKNPKQYVVKEELLPSSASKERSLLNDFFGWTNKIGGIYWQKTINNKELFELYLLKGISIKGEISDKGSLEITYNKNKIVIDDNSMLLQRGENSICINNSGINLNSVGDININAKGNVNIKGANINLN